MMEQQIFEKFRSVNNSFIQLFSIVRWEDIKLKLGIDRIK